MDIGNRLRSARLAAGLTQTEVAQRAHTSQAAIASYERSRKAPSLRTLERVAEAIGATVRLDVVLGGDLELRERPVDALSLEERRSLWLHRGVAARIQEAPADALERARSNLDRTPSREPWPTIWRELLDQPLEAVLAALLSTSTYGSQLRQTAPFAGLLSAKERWAAYRTFTEVAREARGA